jgi:hypothetical protein
MTVLQHLDALVFMEMDYHKKASCVDSQFSGCFALCAEFCAWHREILESNCGEFLDREILGSQAAELSHQILQPERVEAILNV